MIVLKIFVICFVSLLILEKFIRFIERHGY